jgi:lipid A 3-O-deacylase
MSNIRAAVLALLCFSFPAAAESPRVIGSLGQQIDPSSTEAYLRYLGSPVFWKFQPVLGVSGAANGSGWAGVGAATTWRLHDAGVFLRTSTMVGVQRRGSGPNLGGPIQFRSALDLGVQRPSGVEYGVGADHRSNAGLYKPNPGLNSVYLFASIPLE